MLFPLPGTSRTPPRHLSPVTHSLIPIQTFQSQRECHFLREISLAPPPVQAQSPYYMLWLYGHFPSQHFTTIVMSHLYPLGPLGQGLCLIPGSWPIAGTEEK